MRIDIAVFDGVDEMDALGPLEVLRAATRVGADLDVRLVTREPQDVVTGLNRLRFLADNVYGPGADVLLVPGGGWSSRSEWGAWGEVQRGDWLPLLASAQDTTGLMAGVCTGTMLLAHAGVVGSRRASTHHAALDISRPPARPSYANALWTRGTWLPAGALPAGSTWRCGWWSATAHVNSQTGSLGGWSTSASARRSRRSLVPASTRKNILPGGWWQ